MLHSWQAPGGSTELVIRIGPDSGPRLLVLPAWFDEGNKLRHFTIEVMRHLARHGIASALPDLPGCNESLAPLEMQDIASWRTATVSAAQQLGCSHVLAIRAGANLAPALPGWAYAPLTARSALRAMLRARVISDKEAGLEETRDGLLARGKAEGIELAGYRLNAEMVQQLAEEELPIPMPLAEVPQSALGGPGLWLRAEPEHDPQQAIALAEHIAAGIGA